MDDLLVLLPASNTLSPKHQTSPKWLAPDRQQLSNLVTSTNELHKNHCVLAQKLADVEEELEGVLNDLDAMGLSASAMCATSRQEFCNLLREAEDQETVFSEDALETLNLNIFEKASLGYFRYLHGKEFSYVSRKNAYSGLIEEVQHGMSGNGSKELVHNVLSRFFSRPVLTLCRRLCTQFPDRMASLFTKTMPVVFSWLVGRMQVTGDLEVAIPRCRFLRHNGQEACLIMCKKATESFFKEKLNLPLHLQPNFELNCCSITFGHIAEANLANPPPIAGRDGDERLLSPLSARRRHTPIAYDDEPTSPPATFVSNTGAEQCAAAMRTEKRLKKDIAVLLKKLEIAQAELSLMKRKLREREVREEDAEPKEAVEVSEVENEWEESLGYMDAMLLSYFRSIKGKHIGFKSSSDGYHGFLSESYMTMNTRNPEDVSQAVQTMYEHFFGSYTIAALKLANYQFPKAMAKIFARLTPRLFFFLVGPSHVNGATTVLIPRCKFLARAGEHSCMYECKTPTEAFFTNRLGLELSLTPNHDTCSCQIRYGATDW